MVRKKDSRIICICIYIYIYIYIHIRKRGTCKRACSDRLDQSEEKSSFQSEYFRVTTGEETRAIARVVDLQVKLVSSQYTRVNREISRYSGKGEETIYAYRTSAAT